MMPDGASEVLSKSAVCQQPGLLSKLEFPGTEQHGGSGLSLVAVTGRGKLVSLGDGVECQIPIATSA